MATMTRPDRTEAAEYYFRYIDRVSDDTDIIRTLEDQLPATLELFRGISDEQSLHRYAPDKWSIREVVNHMSDTERLFVFRALWFGRGFDSPLPSFEQEIAKAAARAEERPWEAHIEEFGAVRAATIHFFRNLPHDAWERRGIASGNPFSVRALAYLAAGHVIHHVSILRERYL
jgi:uncharacterized damage-inducible protein DinB